MSDPIGFSCDPSITEHIDKRPRPPVQEGMPTDCVIPNCPRHHPPAATESTPDALCYSDDLGTFRESEIAATVPIGTAPLPDFVTEKWREWLNVLIEAGIRGHRATETREQIIGLMGDTYFALKMARAELTTARSTISELQKLAEAVGAWVARPAGPSADNSLEIAFHQFRRRTPTTTGNTE